MLQLIMTLGDGPTVWFHLTRLYAGNPYPASKVPAGTDVQIRHLGRTIRLDRHAGREHRWHPVYRVGGGLSDVRLRYNSLADSIGIR